MTTSQPDPVAVVGLAAIMPQAPTAETFWTNLKKGVYSITDVPPERWDPAVYYDPDHSAIDKTYSRIGGWVREFEWNPIAWRLPIPPKVAEQMDQGQRWAVSAARAALTDAGYPDWTVDGDRVAVILGNAIGGEKHYQSSMRIRLPEMLLRLQESPTLRGLAPDVQQRIVDETRSLYRNNVFDITEDTMPGELSNVMAGRVANLFNLRGPNFTTDAACASALAAIDNAVMGLREHRFDAAVCGGVDRNMGVDAFVKFCKIGALSATGTRPFDAGADGFVMGEGAAVFVLKRLEDAERAGDRIYATILGIAGSSDGKGKGITAPNPVGQQLAVRRAWQDAGEDMGTVSSIEAHGTSTRVGDAAELTSLSEVFGSAGLAPRSVALGSVKSNIGHLKAAAGAAGLFKMVRSLHEKVLVPSLSFTDPNPGVDWDTSAFAVNTALREWPEPPGGIRRGGVSAFGFGGTNYHVVVEEHVPGRHRPRPRVHASAQVPQATVGAGSYGDAANSPDTPPATPIILDVGPSSKAKAPLRGALVLGAANDAEMVRRLTAVRDAALAGQAPAPAAPDRSVGAAAVRVAVDFGSAEELAGKLDKVIMGLQTGNSAVLKMMRQQGAFVGRGPAPKVAFLYTGQGSQYVNMLRGLAAAEPVVGETFAEADRVMSPLLGTPLTDYIFVDPADEAAVAAAGRQLMQTEITQPAVLATDLALTRLLAAYGIRPDMVMGHSLGEYGALVAAGALSFEGSLEAVSARGREMAHLSVEDNGAMAAVFGPLETIQRMVEQADGYAVVANINSYSQAVVGGATAAVERLIERFTEAGMTASRIPVSHAFHTSIVAPASVPFGEALRRLDVRPPTRPIVANVTGEFYPADATTETMLDYARRQIASPVQFVKGLETLYAAGARVFVEVGPKKALHGFVEDVLAARHDDVVTLFTNHPKIADEVGVNQALCGLWAAGVGFADVPTGSRVPATPSARAVGQITLPEAAVSDETITELGRLFAGVLEEGMRLYRGDAGMGGSGRDSAVTPSVASASSAAGRTQQPAPTTGSPRPGAGLATTAPVVITGAALGLPGVDRTFDDENVARILAGQSFIESLPQDVRARMVDMRITRVVKDAATGGGSFVTIDDPADVIKLAARHAPLDMVGQFGIDRARDEALDNTTRLAIGAGFDAMRDAGIPLTLRYKTTTIGSQLPDTWGLPEALRDDTGVIFASAFPGYDRFAEAIEEYALDRGRRENLAALQGVRQRMPDGAGVEEVDRLIAELTADIEANPYHFDRRFLFRALAMGHSQFAEIIGARGPNTQVNAACASTTQALSVAEDWIRSGRAKRVIIVSADDATAPHLLPWVTAGFLASGAAATDERVEDAATPFDRRRHGMIVGMGAAALVVESAESARERGLSPIAEVLATVTANSAFHGTRLDVEHIGGVMESLIVQAERRGVKRHEIAGRTMFMSHETYTPARGGSAAAEINALRRAFGEHAGEVVITNTKGFTGHAMGAGIEDVVAVKALETGIVPPVPNYKEPDPDLGELNLSTGGRYEVEYALRLAAGFGSQIAMALLHRTPLPGGARRGPDGLGFAYRIVDRHAWQHWLDGLSGHADSTLEVDHRRLRVTDVGAPAVPVTPVTHVPVPYPGIAGSSATLHGSSPIAPTIDYPKPFDHTAGAKAASAPESASAPPPAPTSAPPSPAAAPVSEPPATASPAAAPEPSGDAVLAKVTAIVSEMTGYPADLLDPDLDLEADLGVDTVKQAEVFAAVREEYGVERDATLQLRDFPTLHHVAAWVRDKTGISGAATTEGAAGAPDGGAAGAPTHSTATPHAPTMVMVEGDLAAIDTLPRRIPVPSLRPSASGCVETGVTLEGARIVVMLDEGGVGRSLVGRLEQAGATALTLDAGVSTEDLSRALDDWLADGPISGVYWLPALDAEGDHAELDLAGWTEALRRRVKALYTMMRRLWDDAPFLVSATRLGGCHGYDGAGASNPMGGAVTGFTKSYKKERPDALVKAVDFAASRKTAALADQLVEETLRDPGVVEIGRTDDRRWGVAFTERPFPPLGEDGSSQGSDGMSLGPDSVVVVTGAAGSIVSAITADLAAASGGTFHLLDLTPEPDRDDPDLAAFASDREGLKATLAARIKAAGERPTPVAIEKEIARLERLASAAAAIDAVESAGGTAHYHCVDLTDADAVTAVGERIARSSGAVDVLLHAAGLEISRNLPEKEPREFDLVFDVKTTGWFTLWRALSPLEIGATVVFSSVAGRFGNQGQTDYAAANDLLCKIASSMRRTRPETRALALDWTAWGGIGMATRGSIPRIMELAGVQLLPPEAGVAWIRRELTSSGHSGEVIVAGTLGMMAAEYADGGGLDGARLLEDRARGPMLGEVSGSVHRGIVVKTTLDPQEQPFLDHHRIDGTAVLPGVMGMEAFAEVADLVAPSGYRVAAVEDVAFQAPLKFYRDEPRAVTVSALTRPDPDGEDLLVECALTAERRLPGQDAPTVTTHFTATVRLTTADPAEETIDPVGDPAGKELSPEEVYRLYFHGPAYQVVGAAWAADGASVARLAEGLPDNHSPANAPLVGAPRLAELGFQAAGLWEAGRDGRLALPHRVGSMRVLPAESDGPLYAVARQSGEATFDIRVVNGDGRVIVHLADYVSIPLPSPIDTEVGAPLAEVFGA